MTDQEVRCYRSAFSASSQSGDLISSRQVQWTPINKSSPDSRPMTILRSESSASSVQHSGARPSSSSKLREAILKSADAMSTCFLHPKRKASQDSLKPRKNARTVPAPKANIHRTGKQASEPSVSHAKPNRKLLSKRANLCTQAPLSSDSKVTEMDECTSEPQEQADQKPPKKQTAKEYRTRIDTFIKNGQSTNKNATAVTEGPKKHSIAPSDDTELQRLLAKPPDVQTQVPAINEEERTDELARTEPVHDIILFPHASTDTPEEFMDDDDSIFDEVFELSSGNLQACHKAPTDRATASLVDSTSEADLEALLAADTPPSLFNENTGLSSPPCAQPVTPTPLRGPHRSIPAMSAKLSSEKPLQPFLARCSSLILCETNHVQAPGPIGAQIPTFFRIAEALQSYSATKKTMTDEHVFALELYAQIIDSGRDGQARWCLFRDLFFPKHPPYLKGELTEKGSQDLLPRGSAPLFELNGNGSQRAPSSKGFQLCHVQLRTKLQHNIATRKPQSSAVIEGQQIVWEISKIRTIDWNEIEQAKNALGIKPSKAT